MRILYWNTCLTTDPETLFSRLMLCHQVYKGIDYFCLNEATPGLVDLFKQEGWRVFHIDNTDAKSVLIASKHPLHQKRSYLLSSAMRKGRENKNHLLMIEAYWRNKPLTIATTHLTYLRFKEMKRRRAERRELIRILPRNRTVFGGDLNTVVIPFAKWDVEQIGYQNRVKGKTWCWHLKNTFIRVPVKLQLDYVFAANDIATAVDAKILKEQAISDHFPILVTLY